MIVIQDDLYDIAWRLKVIDEGYFPVYNTHKKCFEIWHKAGEKSSLACTLPYDRLDVRALDYVKKTRCENILKLIAEIDAHNQKIVQEKEKHTSDMVKYKTKHLVEYYERGGKEDVEFSKV